MPSLPIPLRIVRNFLQRLNYHLSPALDSHTEEFDAVKVRAAEDALRGLPGPDAYLNKHLTRLARTLALVPPPQSTGRVLELGCYMQITPMLQRICGYREVRGAYFGTAGTVDRKSLRFSDGEFSCEIDHFDAERDRFPYSDGHFDLVIAGEIIEHLLRDPMHMLLETRRVLADGGFLLVTTPNVGSVTSVARTLDGLENPQVFSLYERPSDGNAEIGHMREYTTQELGQAVRAAGFEVTRLFTSFIDEFVAYRPLLEFLAANGYDTANRGEQTWCLARKCAGLPVDRYPGFLYVS